MVEEILDTRLMVKRCMSRYKSDKGLHKLLHARQLGLKLIANVTFGYAAANFSGRMPCVEVGGALIFPHPRTLPFPLCVPSSNAAALMNNSRKFIVTISVKTPDGNGVLKQAKDIFICDTGAIMTSCSS